MNPINLFRPARLLLVTLLAFPTTALLAQEATPAAKSGRNQLNSEELSLTKLSTASHISVDFPGGPLSKLAAKLNESGETKLSIVQGPGLDPVLPAFSVRNVRVQALVQALNRILVSDGFALESAEHNLAVLSKIEMARPGSAFASLQLDRKLSPSSGWTSDEIIAAIQMGTEFANPEGKSSTLRFKYHPATKLLFVAGTHQEVDIAQRVFGSLPDVSPTKAGTPAAPEKK